MDSIDYSTPAPAAEAAASPAADSPAAVEAGTPAATAPVEGGAATPDAAKPNLADVDERVIELTRKARTHESRAAMATKEADAAKAQLAQVQPVLELLRTAQDDPVAFIEEIADVVNIDPARVMEFWAARGSGGKVELTPDDRIKMLEAQIADLRAGKAEPEKKPEAAKVDHAPTLRETLQDAAEIFPECSKEGDVAVQAAAILLEKNPGMAPTKALFAIEKTLRRKAQPNESQAPAGATPTPPRNGGLSRSNSGAVVPAASGIPSDDEWRASIRRSLGGS